MFCYASPVRSSVSSGLGFAIVSDYNQIIPARSVAVTAESSLVAELTAVKIALEYCCWRSLGPDYVHTDYTSFVEILQHEDGCVTW